MLKLRQVKTKRKMPSLLNRLKVLYYVVPKRLWLGISFLASIVSFGYSIYISFIRQNNIDQGWQVWAAWSVTLITGFISVYKMRVQAKALDDPDIKPAFDPNAFANALGKLKLPPDMVKAGYEILRGGLGKNIITRETFEGVSSISSEVNRRLWRMSAKDFKVTVPDECRGLFRIGYRTWSWPQRQDLLVHAAMQTLTYTSSVANETKIRLRKDLIPKPEDVGKIEIEIEKTDYFSDLMTGQLTGTPFVDSKKSPVYNGYELAFDLIDDKFVLKTCRHSSCSNQLGVSAMLVLVELGRPTPTNKLGIRGWVVISGQGSGTVQSAGLLAPSGSGSLDWSDYLDHRDRFIWEGMLRETLEETTDTKKLRHDPKTKMVMTGFGRMLHRGGKPEFYGLIATPLKDFALGVDKSEKKFIAGHKHEEVNPLNSKNLRNVLTQYAEDNKKRLSHPLFMAIHLANMYLKNQPNEFDEMLKTMATQLRTESEQEAASTSHEVKRKGPLF